MVSKRLDLVETIALTPTESISSLSSIKPKPSVALFRKALITYYSLISRLHHIPFKAQLKFMGATTALSCFVGIFILQIPVYKQNYHSPERYAVFSSKPFTLESMGQNLDYKDSRAVKIDSVFKHFKCPLEGYGQVFVEEADTNNIPYWVVAAISFQESSCGKNTPVTNGKKTTNAWGWATYGDQVYDFDSFEHGIKIVSKYMGKKFYSQGITDLCEIMRVYTPPSQGSWCAGVGYFGEYIQNYQTPQ